MNPVTLITALLKAMAAFFNAFPVALAWKITADIEKLNQQIIRHEAANTPLDRRLADELRISLAYRRRLHAALLPADPLR